MDKSGDRAPASKRPRIPEASSSAAGASNVGPGAIVPYASSPPPQDANLPDADDADVELLLRNLLRRSFGVNPTLITKLKVANELGYAPRTNNRILTARYYTVNVTNVRNAMVTVLTAYLNFKYTDLNVLPARAAAAEIAQIVPITVDACMSALYAKMRTIHKAYGTYASRFLTPPLYNKDIELPLPFADAISNFGVFDTTNMVTNYHMVPVYPENIQYEGRSTNQWHSYQYASCVTTLKKLKIPFKSIDSRIKTGTPWWTYYPMVRNNTCDLEMIIPYQHYSNHSAVTALMYLLTNEEGEPAPIITHQEEETNYGCRVKMATPDHRLKAFAALCQADKDEWDLGVSNV